MITDMTAPWKAQAYKDKFSLAIQALVDKKVAAGDTETVVVLEQDDARTSASNVVDLTELLARSLARRGPDTQPRTGRNAPKGPAAGPRSSRKAVAKPAVRKRT